MLAKQQKEVGIRLEMLRMIVDGAEMQSLLQLGEIDKKVK